MKEVSYFVGEDFYIGNADNVYEIPEDANDIFFEGDIYAKRSDLIRWLDEIEYDSDMPYIPTLDDIEMANYYAILPASILYTYIKGLPISITKDDIGFDLNGKISFNMTMMDVVNKFVTYVKNYEFVEVQYV